MEKIGCETVIFMLLFSTFLDRIGGWVSSFQFLLLGTILIIIGARDYTKKKASGQKVTVYVGIIVVGILMIIDSIITIFCMIRA